MQQPSLLQLLPTRINNPSPAAACVQEILQGEKYKSFVFEDTPTNVKVFGGHEGNKKYEGDEGSKAHAAIIKETGLWPTDDNIVAVGLTPNSAEVNPHSPDDATISGAFKAGFA